MASTGVPPIVGSSGQGMFGAKSKLMAVIGDEVRFMASNFVSQPIDSLLFRIGYSHWFSNGWNR